MENSDELLSSPSTSFCLLHDSCWTSTKCWELCKQCLRVPFMKLMLGWKKWLPRIHVHLVQVAAVSSRKIVFVSGTIPSQLCMCECILWFGRLITSIPYVFLAHQATNWFVQGKGVGVLILDHAQDSNILDGGSPPELGSVLSQDYYVVMLVRDSVFTCV